MFQLPQDEWICQNCGQEWFAEYGRGEMITCVSCKSKSVVQINLETYKVDKVFGGREALDRARAYAENIDLARVVQAKALTQRQSDEAGLTRDGHYVVKNGKKYSRAVLVPPKPTTQQETLEILLDDPATEARVQAKMQIVVDSLCKDIHNLPEEVEHSGTELLVRPDGKLICQVSFDCPFEL